MKWNIGNGPQHTICDWPKHRPRFQEDWNHKTVTTVASFLSPVWGLIERIIASAAFPSCSSLFHFMWNRHHGVTLKQTPNRYVRACVCASSVHSNLVYAFAKTPAILAFLLLQSSSLFCYESSCVYFDDEFHMTDISCSHQKVTLGRGCQPKITVGVFSTVFFSDLRMHTYMRAPSLGGVSFVSFLFPWQNLISPQFSSIAEVNRFKFTDQKVSI